MEQLELPSVVGITGTNGAGKDVLAQLLVDKSGYQHVSLSDVLRSELTKLGQPHTRQNLSALSKSIRTNEGDSAMVNRLFSQPETAQKICITSIRTPGEAQAIKQRGGCIIWVDADPQLRYQRVTGGQRARVTDTVSYDEFIRQEQAEMTPTEAGGGLNMAAVHKVADLEVTNDFANLVEFENHLQQIIKLGNK